jgi:transcription antitermination factor NusG
VILISVNQWFAIYVKPKTEKSVAAALRLKGYEEFLPMYRCRQKLRKKPLMCEAPLFPNYVFCRLNSETYGPIVTTPGVVRIVGFGGRPFPLEELEIRSIQSLIYAKMEPTPCPYLAVGEFIYVKEGPLMGTSGWITRIGNKARLVVSISLLQRSVAVELDSSLVQPVSSPMPIAV